MQAVIEENLKRSRDAKKAEGAKKVEAPKKVVSSKEFRILFSERTKKAEAANHFWKLKALGDGEEVKADIDMDKFDMN